jgi:O-antigen ligase
LLALPLAREERFRLLAVLLLLGLVSGLVGLLQASDGGPTFYRVSTPGEASGLFANRNHQAALLATLFPMLAVFAWAGLRTLDQARLRWALALAAGGVFVPLLLVTGSRMGFLLGGVGLAAVPLLYHRPALDHVAARLRRKRSMMIPGLVGGVGVIVLVLLALLFARAGALSRMLATDQTQDLRFRVWGPIVDMTARYLPFGTGLGSFEIIFKLNEPNALLKPTYLNHAHNDWLEIALTGGIGAVALAMVAVAWWAKASLRAWRGDGTTRNVAFARLGMIVLGMLAAASVPDYPLRTPSLMCVAVIAVLWLHGALPPPGTPLGGRKLVDVAGTVE